MKYAEAIDWLYGTQLFGIKLGLENTARLLDETGVTARLPGKKIIHVAGTNGKGSVCAYGQRILTDAGIVTGLFTSPHLVSYRERIRIGDSQASEEDIASQLNVIRELVADWDNHPTFFEISLALALHIFVEAEVEVIILETGMGGRLDATNAVQADVSVITSISMDHSQWLGNSIREIAAEKAGIIKPATPVVVADLHPDARDVIGRRALALGVPYIEAHSIPDNWKTGLPGSHQRENSALAVEAVCRVAGERLTQEGIEKSIRTTRWPGRFQVIADRYILDGAHNVAGAASLLDTWQTEFGTEKATLIFGAAKGKEISAMFEFLAPIAERVILVPIRSERRLSVDEMKSALGEMILEVDTASDGAEAIEKAEAFEEKILIAGSLYLVGEILGFFEGKRFEVSEQ